MNHAVQKVGKHVDVGAILSHGMETHSKMLASTKRVNGIWQELCKRELPRPDAAPDGLIHKRGLLKPRRWIGSGFANLTCEDVDLFEAQHQGLIRSRLDVSPQLVAPLRGVHSDEVKNLFFRSMGTVAKGDKSWLLTGVGGWANVFKMFVDLGDFL